MPAEQWRTARESSLDRAMVVAAAAVCMGVTNAGAAQTDKSAAAAKQAQDVKAIQKTADVFTKAFNAGDAKAIAGQFTPDAEMIDADGSVLSGREAIQKEFEAIFAENPGRKMQITLDFLRFIGRDVAVEEGMTRVSQPEGGATTTNRYTAIHVKRDGKWMVARVQDSAPEVSSNYERLQELEWMVGDWVDEGEDSLVVRVGQARPQVIPARGHDGCRQVPVLQNQGTDEDAYQQRQNHSPTDNREYDGC